MVFTKVKEVHDISMPRLKVDGKGTWSFVATLVHITSSIIEDPQHWYQAIGRAISLGGGEYN